MNKQSMGVNSIGASLLLTVFLVLCLTIFAVLSLSSAKSDLNFSKKAAEENRAYYDAVTRAEQKIARYAEEGNAGAITFTEKINERKELLVLITLDGGKVRRKIMKTVDTDAWDGNQKLELIDHFN